MTFKVVFSVHPIFLGQRAIIQLRSMSKLTPHSRLPPIRYPIYNIWSTRTEDMVVRLRLTDSITVISGLEKSMEFDRSFPKLWVLKLSRSIVKY